MQDCQPVWSKCFAVTAALDYIGRFFCGKDWDFGWCSFSDAMDDVSGVLFLMLWTMCLVFLSEECGCTVVYWVLNFLAISTELVKALPLKMIASFVVAFAFLPSMALMVCHSLFELVLWSNDSTYDRHLSCFHSIIAVVMLLFSAAKFGAAGLTRHTLSLSSISDTISAGSGWEFSFLLPLGM